MKQVAACFKNGKNVGYLWRTRGMAISWTKPVLLSVVNPPYLLNSRCANFGGSRGTVCQDDNGPAG